MARHGENIRKRSDGRWEARVIQGPAVNGKTNYKYIYGHTYCEVLQKKQAYEDTDCEQLKKRDAVLPKEADSDDTLREVTEEWLETKKPNVKESTYANYTVAIENHILPALGDMALKELDSAQLNAYLTEQKVHGRCIGEEPLSDKAISDIKSILMQILHYAHSCGKISQMPECAVPSGRQPEIRVMTRKEQHRMEELAVAEDTPFCHGVLLTLCAGLRIGEVCALQWKDFDLLNEAVHITKTIMRIKNVGNDGSAKTKVIISTPKTECSLRTIPLPEATFQYFISHKRGDEDYLMTGQSRYMEPRVCREQYKSLLRRAGISDYTYHTLRHTFATRCVENNMDIKSLSEIMGHSNIKITMQRYVHPSMDTKRNQLAKLPSFIN
ncbi:MAG: site-specific integrase [Clostridiales bacterium]|nr:site-specific integrase [Clostridiales bacterium]